MKVTNEPNDHFINLGSLARLLLSQSYQTRIQSTPGRGQTKNGRGQEKRHGGQKTLQQVQFFCLDVKQNQPF